jgi:hypothetical protein
MTAEREETKYLVPEDGVDCLVSALGQVLACHRFSGEHANLLPDPRHFVTTVYFDTPGRVHFRLASSNLENNVKLRAKEYYDLHPSLAELATDPSEILRYQPWLWFELKRREGQRTAKRRVRLRKLDLPRFLAGDYTLADLSQGPRAVKDWEQIVDYCQNLAEPVLVSCLVNYQRFSWQDETGAIRVTVDYDLAFYAPPLDLWTRQTPLVAGTLGPVRGRHRVVLVEVKRRGALPCWLDSTLERAGARPAVFSKFVQASQAVHGHG